MGQDVNPLDTMKTLLTDNWNTSNTDSITPVIAKKYEHPKNYQLKPNSDLIYVYANNTALSPSGIGLSTYSDMAENIVIDVRVRPAQNSLTSDTHARKVLYEILRIVKGNINNPNSDFTIINQDISYTDTSNTVVGIFRYVFDLQLQQYHRNIN